MHIDSVKMNHIAFRGFRYVTVLCTLITSVFCLGSSHASERAFIEAFQSYVDNQIEQANACASINCFDHLDIPIVRFDGGDSLIYWNQAAMTLNFSTNSSGIVTNQIGDYLQYQLGDHVRAFIPLRYKNLTHQTKFLCQEIGPDYQLTTYQIESVSAAEPKNITDWLSNIQMKQTSGRGYMILYFLFILISLLLILKWSNYFINTFGDLLGSCIVILMLTCVRLLFGISSITKTLSHHDIFTHQVNTSILSPSLGELFINMLLFFVITIFLLKSFDNRPLKKHSKLFRWYLLVSGYLLVMMSIISFVYVVKRVVIHSPISFQFGKIYVLDWSTHIFILSILLFICSLFFLSYLLIKILRSTGAKLGQRLIAFFIATLATFPIFLNFSLHISAFGFYVLVLSILILMDLFVETRQKSISWLVIWLVTIASGTTALLYSHNAVAEYFKGLELAKTLAHTYESENFDTIKEIDNPERYKWAIYDGYNVVKQWSNPPLNLMTDENIPPLGQANHFNEYKQRSLVYRDSPGSLVIVSKSQNIVIQFISLFSFLFTSLTIVIILIFILNYFLKFLPQAWNLNIRRESGIRRKIQYVIFSMLILSFATVFAVTSFYLKDIRSPDSSTLTKNQQLGLHFFAEHLKNLNIDQINVGGLSDWEHFDAQFDLFSAAGLRLTSSANLHINRPPFSFINNALGSNPLDLSIQQFEWTSSFRRINIKDKDYIISASNKQNVVDEDYVVNNLLGTLLNLYIFLFVIASSIALTFSDTITRPLLKLREKFSSVKIGYSNERIEWQSNDELGQLIQDYNSMLGKIEESVSTLAMTERELAWREMAKQVAHEIKNPLTPMKLSLQHLQLAAKRDPEHAHKLIERVGKTLLEQIDNLSRIASEFSNFAKMPKPENKKVILNDVASSVHDLFRKREDMDISLYIPIDEIYVFGDHHYMTRVLINLLKNAIQAIPNDRRGHIKIHVYKESDNAVIKVIDNGTGIPKNIRDKVFQPNFTSKNSGTGLGLAICANIIESFNGKIYFETEVNVGTTFFIEIPLMHMADNFKKEEHVIL